MSENMKTDLEILVGKIIKEVILEKQEFNDHITFNTMDDEKFIFDVYGDCCSDTWIESVEGIDHIIGHKVLSVVCKEIDGIDNESDAEVFYNIDINTSNGCCTIDFRNNNSYYGGSLELRNNHESFR